jgi:hypothetical protein
MHSHKPRVLAALGAAVLFGIGTPLSRRACWGRRLHGSWRPLHLGMTSSSDHRSGRRGGAPRLWPQGFDGSFEWFSAYELAAFVTLFCFKLGIIPVLGACAMLSLVYHLVVYDLVKGWSRGDGSSAR